MLFALHRLAVFISAVLFNGVLVWASTNTALDPGFLQCQECFFKGTPPQSLSELGLEQRCHRHLTGRPFASLYNTNCQTTVYTALHLSLNNGWGRGEQSTQDSKEEINGDSHVAIPALYRGTTNMTPSPSNSPLLKWDALTAELIRSSVIPMCSETSGEIYVQIGVGGFNECGGKLLWSAMCCAAPDGDASFSVGLVKEGDLRVLSITALEELIGVTSLFLGGCGEMGRQGEELASLLNEQLNDIKTPDSGAQSEEDIGVHNTQEAVTSESEIEEVTEHVNGEASSYTSSLSSDMDVEESTNETESSGSALIYILSSTIYLLYAPFSPIVNKVTNFPFQVTYVLQEDLAVLASVPGDSYTLVNNLCSGVCSGVSCVLGTLYQTGETSVCTIYSCLSPLASSLILAFQEGFTGMGTLASDALAIVTGTMGNGFRIIRMVLGSVWDQMLDYLCAVSSEMGCQVSTVEWLRIQ
ncbi:endonuclease domain-containing 1 protein isoform X3 [Chanodichthys erythropterus]|uniref:endonuclease domain-containing 1 protein isoform X3 n=1 Tax=Chanodichthys erythropterus TaxID=933992 RepID=UPI00351E99B2